MGDPGLPVPQPISRRTYAGAAAAAFAAPLLFAAYTHEVWEDYYITYRSSRHLAEGLGLFYQVGEHVHTFTSPLGALIPALCFTLTGGDTSALWLFRIISAAFLSGAALLVVDHVRQQGWSRAFCWLALALGLAEAKVVAFSTNGMETAILVFFAALAWRELTRPGGPRLGLLAVGYGGLMWTRPDAFILAGAMTAGWWVFGPRRWDAAERPWWRSVLAAVAVGGLLYAPWFLWAWHTYGSPVPQTIIAKSALTPGGLSPFRVLGSPLRCLVESTGLDGLFAPIYSNHGWPECLGDACRFLARLAAFLWLFPVLSRPTRAASLAVLVGGVYFDQIMAYPWYYAPWTLLGGLALAGAARTVLERGSPTGRSLTRIVASVAVAMILAVTVAQAYSARQQQRLIEDNGRKQIGLWLKAHAAPGDSVFLEPFGYIGYFSQLKILDYPGLCAPEVSRIVRTGVGGYARLIGTLKPTWLVLRPSEIEEQNLVPAKVLDPYAVAEYSNQRPNVDALTFLPGRSWIEFDSEFVILHRRDAAGPPAAR